MKSELVDQTDSWCSPPSPNRTCTICGAPSNGYHFNAPSCSACAAFFRRTVTLDRRFTCAQDNNCRVNYVMRVICRACRYSKCLSSGMDRKAVQPRRDCNVGRRKINYVNSNHNETVPTKTNTPIDDKLSSVMESSGLHVSPGPFPSHNQILQSIPEMEIRQITPPEIGMPTGTWSQPFNNFPLPDPIYAVDELLREERLYNERRKILYCGRSSISKLLSASEVNDIPFSPEDVQELTFAGVQRDVRAQILVIYEWIRGWSHFSQLNLQDKKTFLRRCILFHTILDPAYLTLRLGYPHRFVMFNGMYIGIAEDSEEGWGDEDVIKSDLKKQLYRPLLERVVNEIVGPMMHIDISYIEYVVLKGLISFKSQNLFGASDVSNGTKEAMSRQIDAIFNGLHAYYRQLGLDEHRIAERVGNLVLLMSSIFAVSLECLESHQKIQFFDLWELDELLLQLLRRTNPGQGWRHRTTSTSNTAMGFTSTLDQLQPHLDASPESSCARVDQKIYYGCTLPPVNTFSPSMQGPLSNGSSGPTSDSSIENNSFEGMETFERCHQRE